MEEAKLHPSETRGGGMWCEQGQHRWAGAGQAPTQPLPPLPGTHRWVLAAIDWTMALSSMSRSRTLEAVPTTAGGRLLEKR